MLLVETVDKQMHIDPMFVSMRMMRVFILVRYLCSVRDDMCISMVCMVQVVMCRKQRSKQYG